MLDNTSVLQTESCFTKDFHLVSERYLNADQNFVRLWTIPFIHKVISDRHLTMSTLKQHSQPNAEESDNQKLFFFITKLHDNISTSTDTIQYNLLLTGLLDNSWKVFWQKIFYILTGFYQKFIFKLNIVNFNMYTWFKLSWLATCHRYDVTKLLST